MAVCLPVDETHPQLTITTLRNFARWRAFDGYFRRSNRKIANEDKAVLETSDPFAVPPAGQEKSVRTDAPTLAFRKLYFERFRDSDAIAGRAPGA